MIKTIKIADKETLSTTSNITNEIETNLGVTTPLDERLSNLIKSIPTGGNIPKLTNVFSIEHDSPTESKKINIIGSGYIVFTNPWQERVSIIDIYIDGNKLPDQYILPHSNAYNIRLDFAKSIKCTFTTGRGLGTCAVFLGGM